MRSNFSLALHRIINSLGIKLARIRNRNKFHIRLIFSCLRNRDGYLLGIGFIGKPGPYTVFYEALMHPVIVDIQMSRDLQASQNPTLVLRNYLGGGIAPCGRRTVASLLVKTAGQMLAVLVSPQEMVQLSHVISMVKPLFLWPNVLRY